MAKTSFVATRFEHMKFTPRKVCTCCSVYEGVDICGGPVLGLGPKKIISIKHMDDELVPDGTSYVQLELAVPSHIRRADDGSYYTLQTSPHALRELDEICALQLLRDHCESVLVDMLASVISSPKIEREYGLKRSQYQPCIDTTEDGQLIIRAFLCAPMKKGMLVMPAGSVRAPSGEFYKNISNQECFIHVGNMMATNVCVRYAALQRNPKVADGPTAYELMVIMTVPRTYRGFISGLLNLIVGARRLKQRSLSPELWMIVAYFMGYEVTD